MQRAAIMAPAEIVDVEHLYLPSSRSVPVQPAAPVANAGVDMKSLERAYIMETLAAVKGSRKLAAQRLGISERTLRYRLQQYREENDAV
jgi:two-component system response regulator FlrC